MQAHNGWTWGVLAALFCILLVAAAILQHRFQCAGVEGDPARSGFLCTNPSAP